MTGTPNDAAIEAWNTVLFDKWCKFRHLMTVGVAGHGTRALELYPPAPGSKVLDIGSSFGDATIEIARLVGPRGHVVGVDAAVNFVEDARKEAAAAGVPGTEFFAGDVQTCDLGGPYDRVFSRFGTMFFLSAVAALRNVRRALTPSGLLTMVVWRKREDNPWLYVAEQCVKGLVPEKRETDQVHCGPGPFSMAGADLVSSQLLAAGFRDIVFHRTELDICIGRDLDEALEFAMALGPAGEALRLAGDDAEALRPVILRSLREGLSQFMRDDGVWAPSSTWIIAARPAA